MKKFKIVISLSLIMIFCGSLYAADHVVTSNADDGGTGTLRYIIANSGDNDGITFNLSSGNETIVLGSVISIDKPLTINGDNGAGSGTDVTIQVTTPGVSGSNYRVFLTNVTSGSTIYLTNMTLKGGDISGGSTFNEQYYGGTILHKGGGTLDIDNLTITGSNADWAGGIYVLDATLIAANCNLSYLYADYGGAIYAEGSTLTINNCTIDNNTTTRTSGGVGIIDTSILTMTNSTISNCSASSGGMGFGGGLYIINSSTADLANCIINNNSTNYNGGGINCGYNCSLSLDECTVSNNSSNSRGGGLYISSSIEVDINNSTINDNTSSDGAGVYIDDDTFSVYYININNSTISGNSSSSNGGGIYAYCMGMIKGDLGLNLILTNCSICGNSSVNGGAGIYCYEDFDGTVNVIITNSILAYNAKNNTNYEDVYNLNDNAILYGNYNIVGDLTLSGSNNTNYGYTNGKGAILFNGYTTIIENLIYKPVLADNGGSTETVALTVLSIALSSGVRTGEYDDSGTTKYVFYNGSDWVNVEDGTTVISSGVTEITTDQRGEPRIDPPAIGAFDDGGTLPVVLSAFTAQYIENTPTIYWSTQSETDNMGWFIYRNDENDFSSSEVISKMIEGHGTTTQQQFYTYEDDLTDARVGDTYYYWLESVDYSGIINHYDRVAVLTIPEHNDPGNNGATEPERFGLFQNEPNPVLSSTKISFNLHETSKVDLTVYNLKGQLVKKLYSGNTSKHTVTWNGKDENGKQLENGVYLYELLVNGKRTETKKLILMK